jgi:hypothetical protein
MDLVPNSIGTTRYQLINAREVVGINMSISSREYYESKRSNISIDIAVKILSFLYDESKYAELSGEIYKIERTYQIGQFIELYLSKTKLKVSDILDYN